jgi:cyclopropane-fatty-acyl-phospholipid synthase
MDGDWSSPDLVSVVRLAVRNLARIDGENRLLNAFSRGLDTLRHRLRGNSIGGSRRNIRAHYDLSNDFFQLFLDRSMMYSCAFFESEGDSLEAAQFQKLDRICRKLRLGPEDHVLEIGTGWGGFAEHAVKHYGCRVTTTTISERQYQHSRQRFDSIAGGERIELLQEDYRNLRGQYDKIVSIEMFEAVGLRYYDEFFRACDRLLRPEGSMLLQSITINEQAFPAYRLRVDFIQKHIFPGAELASVSEVLRSLARVTDLSLYHAEDIGTHYARTLAQWRARFHTARDEVRALGFDDRFIRMWDYYLAYCEGAFLERHIGDFQLLLTKNHSPRKLFGEPWGEEGRAIDPISHLAARTVDTPAYR